MFSVSKIALLLALGCLAVVLADNCGGNCPSGNCPDCKCGWNANYVDAGQACSRFSGWSQSCCRCIIEHESNGNANAQHGNGDGSQDVGLWQINSNNWNECNGGRTPCDVNSNLECAKKIWEWGGNNWNLWATCGVCGCCGRAEDEMRKQLETLENIQ